MGNRNLSEDSSSFKFFHKLAPNFALQDISEKVAKQFTVIVEALEGDFLGDIVSGIRHLWNARESEEKK